MHMTPGQKRNQRLSELGGRFPDADVQSQIALDKEYNAGDDMYVADTGTRMLRHNETFDFFTTHNIPFEVKGMNIFIFEEGRQKFFYYSASLKWKPIGGKKTYYSNGIEHALVVIRRNKAKPREPKPPVKDISTIISESFSSEQLQRINLIEELEAHVQKHGFRLKTTSEERALLKKYQKIISQK